MRRHVFCAAIAASAMWWSAPLPAQENSDAATDSSGAEDPAHEELRALRERLYAAYEQRDIDALLSNVAEDVLITWQNGDQNRGHAEFRAFYDRMMNGESRIVRDISSELEMDDKSILYADDTAVARGRVADHFVLNNGSEFTLHSKWTATVVKIGDAWKVASFHISANIFDNPILGASTNWLKAVGAICGIAGIVLGLIVSIAMRRMASAASRGS